MKKLYFLLLILVAGSVSAQQDAMFSQYMFNTLAINPAYAGSRDVLSVTALNRTQWSGIAGAPRTQTLSMHSPVAKKNIGLGLQIFNDKIGITRTTGAFLSYSYRLKMGNGSLALGIQGGVANFRADYSTVDVSGDAPAGDPSFSQRVNKMLPNFGAGLYYSAKKFYVGLSVPHMLNNTLNENQVRVSNSFVGRQYMQFFLAGGYSFDLSPDLCLKPSALVKAVKGAPLQLDFSANLWIKDRVGVGASYRSGSDLILLFEIQATQQLRFGYAYDFGLNALADYHNGSHELMLRYEFGASKDRILGPRSF
ncbi:MAG: type IX secretion system membrane protein PorP/SprF [Bacteroidota bacterium]